MREPVYFVRDLELLRRITTKDFDHFEDHVGFIEPESETVYFY